jgi:hypothetical protein
MDIQHFEKKGPLMNTLEQFHIYSLWKKERRNPEPDLVHATGCKQPTLSNKYVRNKD